MHEITMKKLEKKKSERRKEVHFDIPREKKDIVVLYEENSMSIKK